MKSHIHLHLKVNDSITVTDADGPNSVKIISISDIQLP